MHISELAPHHVESPREIVHPGDEIRVKILEIDSERRRLSLSAKRVEDQILPVARPGEPAEEPGEGAEQASRGGSAEAAPEASAAVVQEEHGAERTGGRAGRPRPPSVEAPAPAAEARRGARGVRHS